MDELIVDGVAETWDPLIDFGVWLADRLPLEFVHAEVRGDHTTSVGVDLTKRRKGHVLDFSRLRLTGKGCPAVLDLTDSAGIRIAGGLIVGDAADPPAVGVLFSRCLEENHRSAGGHHLRDMSIVGSYSIAAHGNLGAETVFYDRVRLDNQIGIALAFCHRNALGFASSWRTADNQRTATVASVHCLDAQSKSLTEPAVIVAGFDRVHFSGQTAIASPYAAMCVDTASNGIVGPTIADLYARGKSTPSGQLPRCAMLYRGPGGNGIVGHYVRASQMLPSVQGQKPIIVDGTNRFAHCEWIHHETTPEDWGQASFDPAAPSRIWRRGGEVWMP